MELESALGAQGFRTSYSERYDLHLERNAERMTVCLVLDPQAWTSGPGYAGPCYPDVPAGNAVVEFHLTLPRSAS